jgi:hypothetical protein
VGAAEPAIPGRDRNCRSASPLSSVHECTQHGVDAGLIARAAIAEPVEDVLIDPQGDRLLRLRPSDFRLFHAACLFAPVLPDFAFDLEGDLGSLGPCLLPALGGIASSIQAYQAAGKDSHPILVIAVVRR